jgi:hypothetical protein
VVDVVGVVAGIGRGHRYAAVGEEPEGADGRLGILRVGFGEDVRDGESRGVRRGEVEVFAEVGGFLIEEGPLELLVLPVGGPVGGVAYWGF